MNINKFFREVTLKICGTLDIEEAMLSVINILRRELPVERMFLEIYDEELESMRIVAVSTPGESKKVEWYAPLTKEARTELYAFAENYSSEITRSVWLFGEELQEKKLIKEILDFMGLHTSSIIVLPLGMKERELLGGGALVLLAEEGEKFTRKDTELLTILREPFAIAMSNLLKHSEIKLLKDMIADDNYFLHSELHRLSGNEIIGAGFGLKEVMQQVQKVSKLESPVLLLGETGTGKDVIANAIHYSSPRAKKPFIRVNCGAIPDSLIDSELFGHEKGAFTGAMSRKRGRFERANKGTIFLDEIGELPPQAQVRLLKVIQDKEIERVGGTETIPLDIRIIAATNRDLEQMVRDKEFREDLWFRLNVFPLSIPPLRKRKEDIPALVEYFIREKCKELKLSSVPEIDSGIIKNLTGYCWPGNVRELENIVERELIISPEGPLKFSTIKPCTMEDRVLDKRIKTLEQVNKEYITRVLENTGGIIHGKNGAAEILGVNANTLRHRMNKLGISYKKKSS